MKEKQTFQQHSKQEISKKNFSKHLNLYPQISDSSLFISDLKSLLALETDESQKRYSKITFYEKVELYGSKRAFIFVEYDYGNGAGSAFPWKHQVLFDLQGNLIKKFQGLNFQFVEIFPHQNPFLVLTLVTSKGNGGHAIYQMKSDFLENVYEGYSNYAYKTYDAHQDEAIYEPAELQIKVQDYNGDGINDISFSGTETQLKNGTESPVEFIFLYHSPTGHFKAR